MCRNVVISPVIRGPIILTIIAINPRSQNPNPKSPSLWRVALGIWNLGSGIWDLLTMGGNARWRPIPVGRAVPADDTHREACGDRRAGDDARALPPLQAHSDIRAARVARPARLHDRAGHPADGRRHRAAAAQLPGRRFVARRRLSCPLDRWTLRQRHSVATA